MVNYDKNQYDLNPAYCEEVEKVDSFDTGYKCLEGRVKPINVKSCDFSDQIQQKIQAILVQ